MSRLTTTRTVALLAAAALPFALTACGDDSDTGSSASSSSTDAVAGSAAFVDGAWRLRKMLGGGLRQAGGLALGAHEAQQLGQRQRLALARAVEAGPEPWRDGVVRWRRIDLAQWLWEAFGASVSEATVGRELRALGFSKLSARPRHYAQDPEAAEAFKKVSRSAWLRSAPRIPASA